jgi:CheY-like chemotaxis protein
MRREANLPISVLVVDPYPDEADLLATFLALKGVDVRVAAGARSAVEAAAEDAPDALLVRLQQESPDFTGVDVVRSCRSRPATRGLAIVMITTSTRADDRERALQAGCDRVVLLPCPPEDLLVEINDVVERSSARRPRRAEEASAQSRG